MLLDASGIGSSLDRLEQATRPRERARHRIGVSGHRLQAGTGREDHLWQGGDSLADRAAAFAFEQGAARGVVHQSTWAARSVVRVAPREQGSDHGPQFDAAPRELVLESTARPAVPHENSAVDELAQAGREDPAGDFQVSSEIAESPDAEERVANDQQRPALTDDLERPRERAGLVGVVLVEGHPLSMTVR